MLEIENLNISYGKKIVIKDFNLKVSDGKIVALIGPSGVGKSTILKVLAGLKEFSSGSFKINGQSFSKQKIGWIPQNYGLLPFKTVEKNITLNMKITNSINNIDDLIYDLKIGDLLEKYPNQISGGQAQRVAIARAFSINPTILLMDEPFSALDPLTRIEVHRLFNKIWEKNKQTTILVTHDIFEAINIAHKIVILSKNGEIEKEINNSVVKIPFEERRFSKEGIKLNEELIDLVGDIWRVN